MMKRDMYGHMIHMSEKGKGGFGVSVTYSGAEGERSPEFTFFHDSDDFEQAMFTVRFEDGCPMVVNTFGDRTAEVLRLVKEASEL